MCKQCQEKPVYVLTNKRKFCEKCFCRYFEKKVFSAIRKYSLLDNAKRIYVLCTNLKGNTLFNILKKAGKKRGAEISKIKNEIPAKGYEKLALEDSLDDTAFLIMMEMIDKNPNFSIAKPEIIRRTQRGIARCIKPLYFCLDREIVLYAKIKGIKEKTNAKEKDIFKSKVIDFINLMEKKHPEIKNAIVNSALQINALKK